MIKELISEAHKITEKECLKTTCYNCKFHALNRKFGVKTKNPWWLCETINKLDRNYNRQGDKHEY